MGEYPPDIPPGMVYIAEITEHMRSNGCELYQFKMRLSSSNVYDDPMVYKNAVASAAARYEQMTAFKRLALGDGAVVDRQRRCVVRRYVGRQLLFFFIFFKRSLT